MLMLGIVVSGVVAFACVTLDHPCVFSFRHLLFALCNIVLLFTIFVAVHFFIKKSAVPLTPPKKHIDELTGYTTRHAFGQIFEHAILDTRRSLEPLTVLLIDVDHFRTINERYGHNAGDKLLYLLTETIQSLLRASDLTCRWEGDTMLLVLKDCTERDGCRLAAKILEKVRSLEYVTKERQTVTLTTSIGVAQMITGDDSQALVARAETGLHSARDIGRDTYAIGYEWILIDYACNPIF